MSCFLRFSCFILKNSPVTHNEEVERQCRNCQTGLQCVMSCVSAGAQCVSISESSLWLRFYAPAHHSFIYLSLLVLMSAWTLHEMESVHSSYASHKCHFFLYCFETPCILLLLSVCVCAVHLSLSTCAVADLLSACPETVSADLRWIQHRGSLRTKTAFMAS